MREKSQLRQIGDAKARLDFDLAEANRRLLNAQGLSCSRKMVREFLDAGELVTVLADFRKRCDIRGQIRSLDLEAQKLRRREA